MRKNKKMMAAMISAAALTLLAGCGGAAGAGKAADASAQAGADSKYEMAYVLSTRDEYLRTLEDGIRKAAEEKGVDMEYYYAGNDSLRMIDCVEAARNQGKDAVLINLNAAEEAQACIEAAGDMKVVFVNRVPADFDVLGENAVAVASDENESGRFQGEYLADYFKKEGKTDVSYVLLRGTDGLVHTELRSEGAVNALKEAGINVKETAVVEADFDRNTAKEELEGMLPELQYDCIIANNDAMAIGAIMAMKDDGIDPASVPVVGIDATKDGQQAIREGEMAMTVFQSAEGQTEGAVAAAINMLEGNPIEEGTGCEHTSESPYVLYYPFVPVTSENLENI